MSHAAAQIRATVAIVGFGPVGMTLAGLLGRRGIEVIAVDKDTDVFPLPRAAHLDHTALRTLQELGLVEGLLGQLLANEALVLTDETLDPLVTIPAARSSKSGYPASHYFYQPDFDRYLGQAVGQLPSVQVRRGVEIVSLAQQGEHVRLAGYDQTGQAVSINADWVIGCDGATSLVRESISAQLDSLGFDERWLVLDLMLGAAVAQLPQHAQQVCNPRRAWVSNPVPGGRYRIELRVLANEHADALREESFLREFLRPLLGQAPFHIERNAIYEFHALVADRWWAGRVLIAGDAAHQMPPFLGQGMVSGIRDATNLAWKLAGVITNVYPTQILGTYQTERAPHVKAITSAAVEVGRFVSATDAGEVNARNQRLRAGDMSAAPQFRLPDLAPGPLVASGAGDQLPQPVNSVTGLPDLDNRLPDGLVVLSAQRLTDSAELRWWQQVWSATAVCTSELGPAAAAVADWLRARPAQVAIVRPDRYLLITGDSLSEVTRDMKSRARGLVGAD